MEASDSGLKNETACAVKFCCRLGLKKQSNKSFNITFKRFYCYYIMLKSILLLTLSENKNNLPQQYFRICCKLFFSFFRVS